MASQDVRYFKTSVSMLTQDGPKWIWHVILLGLLNLIPIIGQIILYGYGYLWSNRTAWGMNTSPVGRKIEADQVMRLGGITFVIVVVWSIVLSSIAGIISVPLSAIPFIGVLFSLLYVFVSAFITVTTYVAGQRGAIYEKIGAGFGVDKIYDMMQRDWNGLVKISFMNLWMNLVIGIIVTLFIIVPIMPQIVSVMLVGDPLIGADTATLEHMAASGELDSFVNVVMGAIMTSLPFVLIGVALASIFTVFLTLLTINAVGIWTAQFYPECWGPYTQPIPANPRPRSYDAGVYNATPQYKEPVVTHTPIVTPEATAPVEQQPEQQPAVEQQPGQPMQQPTIPASPFGEKNVETPVAPDAPEVEAPKAPEAPAAPEADAPAAPVQPESETPDTAQDETQSGGPEK